MGYSSSMSVTHDPRAVGAISPGLNSPFVAAESRPSDIRHRHQGYGLRFSGLSWGFADLSSIPERRTDDRVLGVFGLLGGSFHSGYCGYSTLVGVVMAILLSVQSRWEYPRLRCNRGDKAGSLVSRQFATRASHRSHAQELRSPRAPHREFGDYVTWFIHRRVLMCRALTDYVEERRRSLGNVGAAEQACSTGMWVSGHVPNVKGSSWAADHFAEATASPRG